MSEENKDYVLLFEAPKIDPPQFRLYYDENTGNVLFYTCEKLEGKYIIVDSVTFACARYDVKVVNGKLVSTNPAHSTGKLVHDTSGTLCSKEDISIIAKNIGPDTQYWKLKIYEL